LIYNRIGIFDTQQFRHRGKALHIAEHHRHLLTLAFYSIPLRKNFFGEAFGKVFLKLQNLKSGGGIDPQFGQLTSSAAPQSPQNAEPSGFSN
jgi:hypothetical protein